MDWGALRGRVLSSLRLGKITLAWLGKIDGQQRCCGKERLVETELARRRSGSLCEYNGDGLEDIAARHKQD